MEDARFRLTDIKFGGLQSIIDGYRADTVIVSIIL
jgi:hypothetical protein